jgi:protein-tyrosine phosphatase
MAYSVKPSVLFVCTANIIRSVMAVAIFKRNIEKFLPLRKWIVESAGVKGLTGEGADPNAVAVMRGLGCDLSRHVARRIYPDLIKNFDLILVSELDHKVALQEAYPEYASKIFVLGEHVGKNIDIPDPLAQPLQAYLKTAREIESRLNKSFFYIILYTLKNYNARLGIKKWKGPSNLVLQDGEAGPSLAAILAALKDFPSENQYDVLQILLQVVSEQKLILSELERIVSRISPPDYELDWLQDIRYHQIARPITCLTKISERMFVHPEIQTNLDQIREEISQPRDKALFDELEKLFTRKYDEYKYRINIWDLSSKYKSLPFKIGDYDEAYKALCAYYFPSIKR